MGIRGRAGRLGQGGITQTRQGPWFAESNKRRLTYSLGFRKAMALPVLEPAEIEVRFLGTLGEPAFQELAKIVSEKLGAHRLDGSWRADAASVEFTPHHTELGGHKLVTPVELGTLQVVVDGGAGSTERMSLQVYRFLVPCYQAWYRILTPSSGAGSVSPSDWGRIRQAYRGLLAALDRLGLDPKAVVWTVRLTESCRQAMRAGADRGLIPPDFFDRVLNEEGSDFRAASWFGDSFLGLHLGEGKEHYLLVDLDPLRTFRVSQLFYLQVGCAKMHELAEEMLRRLRQEEQGRILRLNERPRAAHELRLGQLRSEVDKNLPRREALSQMSWDVAYDLSHADILQDFLHYHVSGLLDGASQEAIPKSRIPTVGWDLGRELELHYEGPIRETERWAKEDLRRAHEDVEAWEQHLQSRMDLLLQVRLERQQYAIFALTGVTILLAIITLVR